MSDTDTRLSSAAAPCSDSWRFALWAMAVAFVLLLALYWRIGLSMVEIWERSGTYAHGYVVPLISAWLAWRDRERLFTLPARPCWWMLLPMAFFGAVLLLGEIGNANSLSQFAFVAMLVLCVPVIAGLGAAAELIFPLAFLFFAVPIGEFLLPQLMSSTADFTVAALRLTGVPVFREGQQLVVPTGHWSVVEACSGIRYLIASLMIGTLYAYLNYHSWFRRLGFMVLSALVPLLANWMRAYLIVLIGHLSGNRLATGVDHIVYGWVFFGLVMAAMFWIGSFWHDQAPPPPPPGSIGGGAPRPASPWGFWLAAAAAILVASVPTLALRAVDKEAGGSSVAHIIPLGAVPGWSEEQAALTTWRPRFVGASDELYRIYRREGKEVGLYCAYYRHQGQGHKVVSSSNILAEVSGEEWTLVASGKTQAPRNGAPFTFETAELLRGEGQERLAVWRWYWIGGHLTANDYLAKVYLALSKLLGRGDDSAAMVIYTKVASGDADALSAFLADAAPVLEQSLKETRKGP